MPKIILVVDDEIDLLKVITFRLKSLGCEVLTAEKGEQAWQIIQERRPDLVLLDLILPDIDGYEVCHRIRNNALLKGTKIIFLTASAMGSADHRQHRLCADDYLIKPFNPEELLAKVKRFIGEG